jgi:hypothetical protein
MDPWNVYMYVCMYVCTSGCITKKNPTGSNTPHTLATPAPLNIKYVYIPSETVTITQFAQHHLENVVP